jgi:hypothetical protein
MSFNNIIFILKNRELYINYIYKIMTDRDQNDNTNTSNNSNDRFKDMELYEDEIKLDEAEKKFYEEFMKSEEFMEDEEFVKKYSKRTRDEEDDDSEEPESKRRKGNDRNESDVSEDSVSDEGEESETERINTKYSKRFDAIEDYKEKNKLLSEVSIQDVMNKLDKNETISKQEFETLNRANRLMDQDILEDKDSIQRMQLYEDFSLSVKKEISDNNARIEDHHNKISEYQARLDELAQESDEMSSNNDDNNSNDESNHDNNSNNSNGNPNSNNSSNSSDPHDDDDDGFDDFPPSFDFDDF